VNHTPVLNDWGARILHSKHVKMNIRHFYEEFVDGHMNISYRYDVSLPRAVLLHLIDHLERDKQFVKFMKDINFFDEQKYDEFLTNGGKYKCEL
jgi:hypothetical protein